MSRPKSPAKLEERIRREFSYLCAVCGKPWPHIHHIDEDATNNAVENLLPLCPNHHLIDAHNPTGKFNPLQLRLFRKHRDPAILLAQFQAVAERLRFLLEPPSPALPFHVQHANAQDLLLFVKSMKMGNYYSERLRPILDARVRHIPSNATTQSTLEAANQMVQAMLQDEKLQTQYCDSLREQTERIVSLVVEQLRFQEWKHVPPYSDA